MIHGPGQAGPWINHWLKVRFRKVVTSRDSAYEKLMRRGNELQVEDNFLVNGSRRGCQIEVSNLNSRKLQLFVLHEKPEAFCGKDNQDDLLGAACNGIENLYPCNSLLAAFQFSQPLQGSSRHYGSFQRAIVWIFVLQKSVVSGKGQV